MSQRWLLILAAVSAAPLAAGSGMKPGLWEFTQVRQVVDGRDMSQQMATARLRMQVLMASMPPERRKQMEDTMNRQGMDFGASHRVCVSAAMAARDQPMIDPQGRCEPDKVTRSGNKTNFELNCTNEGRTTAGKGESTVSGDSISIRTDTTVADARGSHKIQSEMQVKYLGADCQGVHPSDQAGAEAKGAAARK